jgi:transposase
MFYNEGYKMPPVDRNNPVRAKSSDSRVSFMEFQREYPNDAACLDWLWRTRYSEDGEHAHCPKCDRERVFKKYNNAKRRTSYTCTGCGHHVQPTAGTIFNRSSTSLQLWFYAIYLMSSTRCGISAKQLEREIGVNYKTAHRMLRLIREDLMAQGYQGPLSGTVEIDETGIGGKPRIAHQKTMREQGIEPFSPQSRAWHAARKQTVFGMVERDGQVHAEVVPDSQRKTLAPKIYERVVPGSVVYTDESTSYLSLKRDGYLHDSVPHGQKIYVRGDVHTNTIEGFFALLKGGILGTYHSVSPWRLGSYCNEFVWRYNHRDDDEAQFRTLLRNAATS